MEEPMVRTFHFDNDAFQVTFRYDAASGRYYGNYPDFEESPRYTENGWCWITAMQDACPYGVSKYEPSELCMDCGSCEYFLQEQAEDLIGICKNEKNKRQSNR